MIHLYVVNEGVACGNKDGVRAMLRSFLDVPDKCPTCEKIRQSWRIRGVPLDVAPPFPGKKP